MRGDLAIPSRLPEMGQQIEAQFERVRPAIHEIAIFWGMVKLFQAEAERVLSRGATKLQDREGRPSKETDLKALFAKYAPTIEYKQAHRYYCVGSHIAETFELPETLLRKVDLPQLAASQPAALKKIDPRLPKKQQELFDHANGTTQKSWLNQFREGRSERSVAREPRVFAATTEELVSDMRDCGVSCGNALLEANRISAWRALRERELDLMIDEAEKLVAAAKKWRLLPKGSRNDDFLLEVGNEILRRRKDAEARAKRKAGK